MAARFVNASLTPPTTSRITPTTSRAIVWGFDPSKFKDSIDQRSEQDKTMTNSFLRQS